MMMSSSSGVNGASAYCGDACGTLLPPVRGAYGVGASKESGERVDPGLYDPVTEEVSTLRPGAEELGEVVEVEEEACWYMKPGLEQGRRSEGSTARSSSTVSAGRDTLAGRTYPLS